MEQGSKKVKRKDLSRLDFVLEPKRYRLSTAAIDILQASMSSRLHYNEI